MTTKVNSYHYLQKEFGLRLAENENKKLKYQSLLLLGIIFGDCASIVPINQIFLTRTTHTTRTFRSNTSLWGLYLNYVYRGVKTSTNQLNKFALRNTTNMSHKPECPHKVEKKLTPVPTNQFM